jgi:hypothetical protein
MKKKEAFEVMPLEAEIEKTEEPSEIENTEKSELSEMLDGKVKIEWYEKTKHLHQAFYDGIEFAFISTDNRQCTPFAYCKDYLQDTIYSVVNNKNVSIYGFSFDPKLDIHPCLKKVKIVVGNSTDKDLRKKISACKDFINQIEDKLGFRKTSFYECYKPPKKFIRSGIWLTEGSKRWLLSPPMLSMYTLLLRVGFGHEEGKSYKITLDEIAANKKKAYCKADDSRVGDAIQGIYKIIEKGDRYFFCPTMKKNYPASLGTSVLHDDLGICAFSSGTASRHIKDWKKD